MANIQPEELVGLGEIAQEIGVKKQVVSNWRLRHLDFPKPIAELAMGAIWRRGDILSWHKFYKYRKVIKKRNG